MTTLYVNKYVDMQNSFVEIQHIDNVTCNIIISNALT